MHPWSIQKILDRKKEHTRRLTCNFGVGDNLWVRERFKMRYPEDDDGCICVGVTYSDGTIAKLSTLLDNPYDGDRWRPSIHMPRWVSRINLTVQGVGYAPLQNITDEQAKLEGADNREQFIKIWDMIYSKKAPWNSNPMVYDVAFKFNGVTYFPENMDFNPDHRE
jgi:hypothetical protein